MYGNKKSATQAKVFSHTRAWEQQEWNKTKKQKKKVRRDELVWKEVKQARKMKTRRLNYSSGLPSNWGRYALKKWMNYLIAYTYNYNTGGYTTEGRG